MKNNTLVSLLVLVLAAVLIAGIFGAIDFDRGGATADPATCDHLNTAKDYESNGIAQHVYSETCVDCGKLVKELNETHLGVATDCKVAYVSKEQMHETFYRCTQCHYTWSKYEEHNYNANYLCTDCGAMCVHEMTSKPLADGRYHCIYCTYSSAAQSACDKHTWLNSVCTVCGEVCSHLGGNDGLLLDDVANPPYYYCPICDYTTPVSGTP